MKRESIKLVIVSREEDLLISGPSSNWYIEVVEEDLETSLQSLEIAYVESLQWHISLQWHALRSSLDEAYIKQYGDTCFHLISILSFTLSFMLDLSNNKSHAFLVSCVALM